MLAFFPHPYPDELLYSVFARYHKRSGNIAAKTTLEELLGSKTASAVVEFPSHLCELERRMPAGAQYSINDFINQHTMLPIYAPFMSRERVAYIISEMNSNKDVSIQQCAGLIASAVRSFKFLRFCPKCLQEEQNRLGESYWHRSHQFSGVLLCTIHKCLLYDSSVNIHEYKHSFIPATDAVCKPSMERNYSAFVTGKLLWVAESVNWLLTLPSIKYCYEEFRAKYFQLLDKKGLLRGKKSVDQRAFIQQFQVFYGQEVLNLLQSEVGYEETCWLKTIVRKHRQVFHPVRHILVMIFLAGSIQDFFEVEEKNLAPFGKGPWPCLNAAAEHFKKNVIQTVIITKCSDTKKPVGTFHCSCGFIYSRRGPDQAAGDQLRIGRVKSFGVVWQEKLRYFVEEKCFAMREIARNLHVDANTVKKYSALLGLRPSWQEKNPYLKIENNITNIESAEESLRKYREKWLILQATYIQESTTQLRIREPGTYAWLYRHDRSWLKENSPHLVIVVNHNQRVNWIVRDQEVMAKIKCVVDVLKQSNKKPTWITISRIGRSTGLLSLLQKYLYKLPLTAQYLQENTEEIKQFQMRRIRWAVRELLLENVVIRPWQVMRKAGIKSKSVHEFLPFTLNFIAQYESGGNNND